ALLAGLGLANLVLALLASPGGLLAQAGIAPPWPITHAQWSWCANLLGYGVVGGFFVLEFLWRRRRFPDRQHGFVDFVRRLGGLGGGERQPAPPGGRARRAGTAAGRRARVRGRGRGRAVRGGGLAAEQPAPVRHHPGLDRRLNLPGAAAAAAVRPRGAAAAAH